MISHHRSRLVVVPSFEAGRTKEDSLFPLISCLAAAGAHPHTRMFCCLSVSCPRLKCPVPAAATCGLTSVHDVIFIITCPVKRAPGPLQLRFSSSFSCLLTPGKARSEENREKYQ